MNARERKVVIGGVVAVVAILVVGLVPRMVATDTAETPATLQAERLARLQGLAAGRDTLAAVAGAAAVAERRSAARYLRGGTPQVAAAELSGLVQELAEAAHVEVLRESVLPPQPAGRATAVSLQLIGRGDMPGLLDLLQGIDEHARLLRVEEISVSSDPRERAGTASLTITMRLIGYQLPQDGAREER
jgi:hypothetical protein